MQTAGNGSGAAPKKPKKKKRRRSIFGYIVRFIGCIICLGIMACSVGGVLLSMYVVQVTADDAGVLDLDNQKNKQTTILYDANGNESASLTRGENRIWRELSAMPDDLQKAVIAVEDKDFYQENLGINIKRTIGAALNEFTGNRIYGARQGASTLEQQLIKNLTQDDEQDIMRKVREIFRAIGIAKRYSKETVLEAYLNTVPLTGIVCGMEAGAQEYFDKHVEDLTLAECAALASITKAPTTYNPFTNPEQLITRRNHVLALMRDQGYITAQECSSAQAETLTLVESRAAVDNATRTSNNSYFTDAVYEQLMTDLTEKLNYTKEEAQEMIFSGGLRVQTTMDPTVQDAIERLMLNENDEYFPALWHEEPVIMTEYPAGTEDTIVYDETTGLPLTMDGYAVFGAEDIPIYTDEAETVLKMGTAAKENSSDKTQYVCFYERVRTQAACAVLDYNGNILGIGGGLGEKKVDRGTNRATLPHQTGSTMKPIAAYCLALDYKFITYSTPVADSPYYSAANKQVLKPQYAYMDPYSAEAQSRDDVWRDWPQNYGGKGGKGDIILVYDALRQSYNTIAVAVGSMVTPEYMFNFAHDTLNCTYLSAEHDVDLGPLVLGSQYQGLSVVELAGAYSIFNDGSFTTPHYYTKVTDYQGNIVLDNSRYITTTQAISPETARIMNRMLYNVLHDSAGTAYGKAPKGEMEAVAKTGTTSDYRDYTFAALTPYYVSAFWWGFDKPEDMSQYRGGANGSPTQFAWKALMEELQADLPVKEFNNPDTVVERGFSTGSGALASGGRVGYYTEDNLPSDDYAGLVTEDPLAAAVPEG